MSIEPAALSPQKLAEELKSHLKPIVSEHSDQLERQIKAQIAELQGKLAAHERRRTGSHLRLLLAIAALLAISALLFVRHEEAK